MQQPVPASNGSPNSHSPMGRVIVVCTVAAAAFVVGLGDQGPLKDIHQHLGRYLEGDAAESVESQDRAESGPEQSQVKLGQDPFTPAAALHSPVRQQSFSVADIEPNRLVPSVVPTSRVPLVALPEPRTFDLLGIELPAPVRPSPIPVGSEEPPYLLTSGSVAAFEESVNPTGAVASHAFSAPAECEPVVHAVLVLPDGGQETRVSQTSWQPTVDPEPAAQPQDAVVVEPPVETAETTPANGPAPVDSEIQLRVPVNDLTAQVQISGDGDQISLQANAAPINEVLALIAQQHGLNVVAASEVRGNISVNLANARLEDALDAILRVNGYAWTRQKNIILVTSTSREAASLPSAQGQEMRVFPLTWVSGEDIDAVIKGLLSPVGKSFARVTQTGDQRRTQEQLVVADLPENIALIESYIQQTDHPPRQVLIEVHILSVLLDDNTRHGVNLETLLRFGDTNVTFATPGFADDSASPAFIVGIDATDLMGVVEALQATNDAKTLASPKVLAVNGQEAHIQIGERLGYLVTTTTQTSTQENVNFLETGVLLDVTPVIGDDGQVMMTVTPKISDGRINATTSLPEEETTDVSTTVVLQDGHAMVIGGLIDETDTEVQTKIPIAGDLWKVGRLFQRRQTIRTRREIIITLLPRILPYNPDYAPVERNNVIRTTTPLLDGPLCEFPRPFEPELPDAIRHPRTIRFDRLFNSVNDWQNEKPFGADYFFPSTLDHWYYLEDE